MATIVEDLAAAVSANETLSAANTALQAQVAELTGKVSALTNELGTATANVAKLDEAVKAEIAAHAVTQEQLQAKDTELAKAKAALANPAFADAATVGLKTATAEGGSPSSEEPMTKEQAIQIYNKLPDGIEGARMRADFRAKHKELLGL